MEQGKAIIFSAPSGSGKTTIVRHLLRTFPFLSFSISATTRSPRTSREMNGKDYYFLSKDDFVEKVEKGDFIEWEEVYKDVYYGTLKSEVERIWAAGKHVLFDVDVKGGIKLKKYFGENALSVFVKVADISTLEMRLKHRNTESDKQLSKRLAKAEYEMTFESFFDVTLLSTELSKTLAKAEVLILEYLKDQIIY